jgi:uncharacterized protein with GYD domain
MPTFFMLGKYSSEAVKGISADRTGKAVDIIKKHGGEVRSMYALLGAYDLAFIVDLPGMQEAMKASIAIGKLTGISFSTAAALPVEDFDKMIAEG